MINREKVKQAWHDYFVLKKDEVSGINDLIKESWKRSRDNNVDFINENIVDSDRENIKKSIEKNHLLIDLARPYMDDLYSIISDTNFMITLLDKEGFIIDSLVNPTIKQSSEFKNINLSEKRIGTNAMGTSLYLDKPVLTYGEEHCYKLLHKFTTSAAPIHDTKGELIGCIGITGFAADASVHTLGMAMASAYAIENKIRLYHSKNINFFDDYSNIIKDSISDGLVILDNNGLIMSINKNAEKMLALKEENMVNKDIAEIFGVSMDFNKYRADNMDLFNKRMTINIKNKSVHFNISITRLKSDLEMIGYVIMLNNLEGDINNDNKERVNLYSFDDIIGESKLIKDSIEIAKIASNGNSNVLILGESGTGKELFAQSIHSNSPRKDKPFIDINCAALPLSLAESELFGYEGGAYTGSKKEGQPGKFELADGGTIFLDEIGELPLPMQASLLRIIQERRVTRIGSSHSKEIDIMIIAATNRDLFEALKNNTFRADLFYRLNVFTINIPSLKESKEDIPQLVNSFIIKYNEMFNLNIKGVSEEVNHIFNRYSWPGNIRELENIIQRAVQIAKDNKIQPRDLPIYLTTNYIDSKITIESDFTIMETQEYKTIIDTLNNTNGNATLASEILGVSRSTIYRKLSKLGYKIEDFRK